MYCDVDYLTKLMEDYSPKAPRYPFKIVYYDSISFEGCINNPNDLQNNLRNILEWVDKHECFLVIKSKARKPFRRLKNGTRWTFWRLIPPKNVYENYPEDIKDMFVELIKGNKLEFKFQYGDVTPALDAQAVIVVPYVQMALNLLENDIKIIFFDVHHFFHYNGIMHFLKPVIRDTNIKLFGIKLTNWPIENGTVYRWQWTEFPYGDKVVFYDKPESIKAILTDRYQTYRNNRI